MTIQVAIILKLGNGAPPVVLGRVADDQLLALALRSALLVAAERAGYHDAPLPDRLVDGPVRRVM